MKRRLAVTVLCGMLAVSALAGCGEAETAGGSSSGGESKKQEKVTLSLMATPEWVTDAEMELAQQFEEETGIKIDFQIVPGDQYYNVLMTKLNGGEGPDIFGGQSGSYDLVSQYNIEENAIDLTDAPWVEYYNEFEREQTSVNGKIYGVTYFDTTTDFYMVYNKKLFEENGLEIPESFAEFEQVCQKLLDAGVIPVYEPFADGWHHVMWFCEIGGKYEDLRPGLIDQLNNNEITFAEVPEFQEVFDQMNDMAQKGYFGDNYLSDEYANLPMNLGSGEFAMTMAKPGTIAEIAAASDGKYTEEDFGMFLIPTLDNDVLNVHPCGPTRFIYSGGGHIGEAKQYLEYITTKECVQYVIDHDAKIENLPFDLGQQPDYSQYTEDFLDSFEKQGAVFQDVIKYLNPQWNEIGQDVVSMFIGEMTSEDVVKAIDARRATQAEAAGDEAWK